jgi:hypothetical protein
MREVNGWQNIRREGGNTDTGADEQDGLEVQELLRAGAEGPIHHDTGECSVDRRAHHGAPFTSAFLRLEVAADGLGQRCGEVSLDPDVNGDIVLFGGAETS